MDEENEEYGEDGGDFPGDGEHLTAITTRSYALRQRIQEIEFRKVGPVITPVTSHETFGMSQGVRPDEKVAEEMLPSRQQCPTRPAARLLDPPALWAPQSVVSPAAIVRPCVARPHERRR